MKTGKKISITADESIKAALKQLSATGEKALLVVDAQEKLLGSLTDGDIRRHILRDYDLNRPIAEIYNRTPIVLLENEYNADMARQMLKMHKIGLLPIVDGNRKVISYISWNEAFNNGEIEAPPASSLNIPVVIMAGGKGTRLQPFTKVLPKPLIPIGDKTIIDRIIEKFLDYGVNEFYLSINHMSKIMRAYFEEKNAPYNIVFVQEDKPLGTIGSITLMKDMLQKPFIVTNCDIIVKTDYSKLYEFHKTKGFDITIVAALKQYKIPYGICDVDEEGGLLTIEEKPEYNFLANTGFYVLNPSMIELVPENEFFHITDLIAKAMKLNKKVGVFPIYGESWIDVGEWAEYKKALETIDF